MREILVFFRRLAHEIPWSASLCTTAFIEAEVVEVSQTVGHALTTYYGCRPEWGAMNYLVHEEVEREEAGETQGAILKYIRTPDDRRAAEQSMREMHRLLDGYAKGLAREYLSAK
jgi:pyrroloquinoline quinone (PQQ) biosynthesis protein C